MMNTRLNTRGATADEPETDPPCPEPGQVGAADAVPASQVTACCSIRPWLRRRPACTTGAWKNWVDCYRRCRRLRTPAAGEHLSGLFAVSGVVGHCWRCTVQKLPRETVQSVSPALPRALLGWNKCAPYLWICAGLPSIRAGAPTDVFADVDDVRPHRRAGVRYRQLYSSWRCAKCPVAQAEQA